MPAAADVDIDNVNDIGKVETEKADGGSLNEEVDDPLHETEREDTRDRRKVARLQVRPLQRPLQRQARRVPDQRHQREHARLPGQVGVSG